MRISLFGGFKLSDGTQAVPLRESSRRLLAFLCLHYDEEIEHREVARALGIHESGLAGHLFQCRQAIGEAAIPPNAKQLLVASEASIDYVTFTEHINAVNPDSAQGSEEFLKAALLYQQPLLTGGWSDIEKEEWVLEARRSVREEFWQALDSANLDYLAASLRADALVEPLVATVVQTAQRLSVPGLDDPPETLTRFVDALGRQRRFRLITRMDVRLGDAFRESGRRPPRGLVTLFARWKRERAAGSDPRMKSIRQTAHLIPRESVLHDLVDRLADHQVVTMVGPPGLGKSSLAAAACERLREEFRDGACFVELEEWEKLGEQNEYAVAKRILSALGYTTNGDEVNRLKSALERKRLLIILDGCEVQARATGEVVSHLVEGCPDVKILATSRKKLLASAQSEWTVPSLAIPSMSIAGDWDALIQNPCIQIFMRQAELSGVRVPQNSETARLLIALCEATDGLPLAIKLAASLREGLEFEDIVDGLRHKDLGEDDEQWKVERLVERSFRLLPDGAQRVFARLAVFSGGFTLEAVAAVCSDQAVNIRDSLRQLQMASLLTVDDGWYRVLNLIRTVAARKLAASGELADRSLLHCNYFRQVAKKAGQEVLGPGVKKRMVATTANVSNFRKALSWSVDHAPADGLDMASNLWTYWVIQGQLGEGREWLKRLLNATSTPSDSMRARAITGLGVLAYHQSDYEEAVTYSDDAVPLAIQCGDRWLHAVSLVTCAFALVPSGRFIDGRQRIEESVRIAEALNEPWVQALAVSNLAVFETIEALAQQLAVDEGGKSRLLDALEKGVALARESANEWMLALTLVNQAVVVRWLKADADGDTAERLIKESFVLRHEAGDRYGMIQNLFWLAVCACDRKTAGQLKRAAKLLGGMNALSGAGDRIPVPELNRLEYEEVYKHVKVRLGSKFEKYHAEGADLPLKDLATLAIES